MSCYLSIASNSSYGRYNRKFAHIVGLEAAVYFSEILEILERVLEKKSFDLDGWFVVNREYITKRTTFNEIKQHECEDILKELEILQVSNDNPNKIRCDVKTFVRLITEDDIETVKEVKAITRAATKEAKSESKKTGIINNLLSTLHESVEVTDAYKIYLNEAYNKGVCSKARFQSIVDEINRFTSDDSVKLQLLKIGAETGYSKGEWLINYYTRNVACKSTGVQKKAVNLSEVEL